MTVEEKALELVAENRVVLQPGAIAIVAGHHAHYLVQATQSDVVCDCPARRQCAHTLAAMVAWHEQESERLVTPPW